MLPINALCILCSISTLSTFYGDFQSSLWKKGVSTEVRSIVVENGDMANYVLRHEMPYLPSPGKLNRDPLPLSKRYRSHFEIVVSILGAAVGEGEAKYSLMKHTGVNYAQLRKYLRSLSEVGLIEIGIREGCVFYKASEKGRFFLQQYYVLSRMLMKAK